MISSQAQKRDDELAGFMHGLILRLNLRTNNVLGCLDSRDRGAIIQRHWLRAPCLCVESTPRPCSNQDEVVACWKSWQSWVNEKHERSTRVTRKLLCGNVVLVYHLALRESVVSGKINEDRLRWNIFKVYVITAVGFKHYWLAIWLELRTSMDSQYASARDTLEFLEVRIKGKSIVLCKWWGSCFWHSV